jgi:hypothetical protein
MLVELVGKNKIKVTTENQLETNFWENMKKERSQDKAEIKSLKRQLRIATDDLKYKEHELRKIVSEFKGE